MFYLPLSGKTFNFLQTMDQRSICYYAKCMVLSWREDFSKTRILRNGLKGEVGLEDEDRHVDATNGICALVEKKFPVGASKHVRSG